MFCILVSYHSYDGSIPLVAFLTFTFSGYLPKMFQGVKSRCCDKYREAASKISEQVFMIQCTRGEIARKDFSELIHDILRRYICNLGNATAVIPEASSVGLERMSSGRTDAHSCPWALFLLTHAWKVLALRAVDHMRNTRGS